VGAGRHRVITKSAGAVTNAVCRATYVTMTQTLAPGSGSLSPPRMRAHALEIPRERKALPMTGELRLLRYFVAVAEELHFGRAAKRLGIAQPPLSTAIRTFERQLGVELLLRTSRSVKLTAAGESLLRGGRRVLAVYAETLSELDQQARGAQRRLRIGFDATTVAATSRFVREFGEQQPQIELDLSSLSPDEGLDELRAGVVDIAVVRPPVADHSLECQVIFEERRVAALPRDHALARRDSLELADLRGETLVLPRGTQGDWNGARPVSARLADAARSAAPAAASIEELVIRVTAGHGVGVIPESLAESLAGTGFAYVPLIDAPESAVALVWRRHGAVAPVRSFVQTALDACEAGYLAVG
jgi:DNA-binding transcriptional LysR family regulator